MLAQGLSSLWSGVLQTRALASESCGEERIFSQLFSAAESSIYELYGCEVTLRLLVENTDAAKPSMPAATRQKQSH